MGYQKKLVLTGYGENLLKIVRTIYSKKIGVIEAVIPRYGKKNFLNNLRKLKKKIGFKIIYTKNINSFETINLLKKINPDLICNWGYGQLFGEKLLKIPPKGCLNIHPGLLPFGRGSGALQGEIINNQKKIGWTCHLMNNKFDLGTIVSQKIIKLNKNDINLDQIISKLSKNLIVFYIKAIKLVLLKKKMKKKIINSFGRYYPKFSSGDEVIDWNQKSSFILNKLRSRSPQILSVTYLIKNNKRYYIKKATKSKVKDYVFVTGQVIDEEKKRGVLVKTGDNAIWITLGSYDKKNFSTPKFKIGTNFFVNNVGNSLNLLEKINKLEKKIKLLK